MENPRDRPETLSETREAECGAIWRPPLSTVASAPRWSTLVLWVTIMVEHFLLLRACLAAHGCARKYMPETSAHVSAPIFCRIRSIPTSPMCSSASTHTRAFPCYTRCRCSRCKTSQMMSSRRATESRRSAFAVSVWREDAILGSIAPRKYYHFSLRALSLQRARVCGYDRPGACQTSPSSLLSIPGAGRGERTRQPSRGCTPEGAEKQTGQTPRLFRGRQSVSVNTATE